MIWYKMAWAWLQRALQNPTVHSLILVAVAVVGIELERSMNDLDAGLEKQTEAVEQLKTDLQVFKASSSAVTDKLDGRVDLVEQRVRDMDDRLRRREAEFETMLTRQRRAMDAWEAAFDGERGRSGRSPTRN